MGHRSISQDYYVVINDEHEIELHYSMYDDDMMAVPEYEVSLNDDGEEVQNYLQKLEDEYGIDLFDIGIYASKSRPNSPQMEAFLKENTITAEEQ